MPKTLGKFSSVGVAHPDGQSGGPAVRPRQLPQSLTEMCRFFMPKTLEGFSSVGAAHPDG
jgi:hypothetical protein